MGVVYAGEVIPRTTVAGIALGGTSAREAARRLSVLAAAPRTVVVSSRSGRVLVRARDVGFRLDTEATVGRAMSVGRTGALRGWLARPAGLIRSREGPAVYAVSAGRMTRALDRIAAAAGARPSPGSLVIDRRSLSVTTRSPRRVRVLNRAGMAASLLTALRRGGEVRIPPVTRLSPAVDPATLRAVAARARRYLASALTLTGAGEPVTVAPRQVAPVLAVEASGGSRVRLGVDRRRLAALVAMVARSRDRPAVNARASAPAAPIRVDEQLDLSWRPRRARVRISPGRPGRVLERSAAQAAIAAAIRGRRHDAVLSTRPSAPVVATADARRIRYLIGTFTTPYPCCAPRVKNIRLIAEKVNGTIVPAGRQFSLNRVAGERTSADGYVPAPFIADGKMIQSVGGGVSQFSTTTYNAAYFAGLDLDFHQPHSEYISRYPPGREATLNYPSVDLKWTNDTRAPVLIRTATTPTSLTVTFYGDNGGRRVSAAAGPRIPVAGRDFSITVTRTVRYAGGRTVRQPYTTTYDKPPPG